MISDFILIPGIINAWRSQKYLINARIIDPSQKIDFIGGLVIDEKGKIKDIGKHIKNMCCCALCECCEALVCCGCKIFNTALKIFIRNWRTFIKPLPAFQVFS